MREAFDYSRLPSDDTQRRLELERRAEPDPSRPPLPEDIEADLSDVEERSAQCYIHAEEASYRFWRIAERVNSGVVPRGPRRAPSENGSKNGTETP